MIDLNCTAQRAWEVGVGSTSCPLVPTKPSFILPPINSYCLRQWQPSQPSYIYQDILWMSLVHVPHLSYHMRPPAYSHCCHLLAFTRCQLLTLMAMQHDTGRWGNIQIPCRAPTQVLRAGFERLGVCSDVLSPRYAAAALCYLLIPLPAIL